MNYGNFIRASFMKFCVIYLLLWDRRLHILLLVKQDNQKHEYVKTFKCLLVNKI